MVHLFANEDDRNEGGNRDEGKIRPKASTAGFKGTGFKNVVASTNPVFFGYFYIFEKGQNSSTNLSLLFF